MIGPHEVRALACAALAAGNGIRIVVITTRHVIANLHARDLGAHFLDDAGPLVTEHKRKRTVGAGAVEDTVLRRADVVRKDAHEDLMASNLGKLSVDELRFACRTKNRSFN